MDRAHGTLNIRPQTRLAWMGTAQLLRAHKQCCDISWGFPNSQTQKYLNTETCLYGSLHNYTQTWKLGDLAISATAKHDNPWLEIQLEPLAHLSIIH